MSTTMGRIAHSGIVLLVAHLAHVTGVQIQCIECVNYINDTYNDYCPKDWFVDFDRAPKVDCDGLCFTRDDGSDPALVVRGCTSNQDSLPKLLPSTMGCYDWNGTTWCLCDQPFCNFYKLGESMNVSMDAHLTESLTAQDENETRAVEDNLQCYQCVNYDPYGNFHSSCPKNDWVNTETTYSGNCSDACFTRSYRDNATMVSRGCTNDQYGMPHPLPPDGCYDNLGEVWCICRSSYCNGQPIGQSGGVAFDDHLAAMAGIDPSKEPDGIKKCYECLNYVNDVFYPQCPKDSRVRNAALNPCNGTCFTRTSETDDRLVARGCTDTQWGMPDPLPKAGCYDKGGEVWCLCNGSRCNGNAMGQSSGVDFYEHLNDIDLEIVEPDGQRRCYECVNYDIYGNYYPQCAKNSRVRNAYLTPCNGTCFTHSDDLDDRLVFRGCSDTQWKLPDPLPADGCYTYYSSVWCICRKSRCNGAAIGKAQPIELDAHLGGNSGQCCILQLKVFFYTMLFLLLHHVVNAIHVFY